MVLRNHVIIKPFMQTKSESDFTQQNKRRGLHCRAALAYAGKDSASSTGQIIDDEYGRAEKKISWIK